MYSIDRFYVGVVRPSKNINEMQHGDALRKRAEIDEIIENGGIPLDLTDTIPGYDSALTIFIKTGHYDLENVDVFMCLHDLGTYYYRESDVLNPCDSMVPLEDIIPRDSEMWRLSLSPQQARDKFDDIFKNTKHFKPIKDTHPADFFLVGDLELCTSVLVDGELKRINIPQQYLLDNSPSPLMSVYSRGKEVSEVDYEIGIDRTFRRYRTAFCFLFDDLYYNLFDHQKYHSPDKNILGVESRFSPGPTDSYCHDLKPLDVGKKEQLNFDQAIKKQTQYVKKYFK